VVHTHGIIGCDRAVDEGPFWFTLIGRNALVENAVFVPELKQFVLELYKINFRVYFFDHNV